MGNEADSVGDCYRIHKKGSSPTRRIASLRRLTAMAESSSSTSTMNEMVVFMEEEELYGGESGWVEARTSCAHLASLCPDLAHIPLPDTPCSRCDHPAENWMCLSCKDVFCSRFINKHMLSHREETGHCLALSFSDLSVWCFACDAYLDVQRILQLRPVYEVAHLLKFGQRPSFIAVENVPNNTLSEGSSKS